MSWAQWASGCDKLVDNFTQAFFLGGGGLVGDITNLLQLGIRHRHQKHQSAFDVALFATLFYFTNAEQKIDLKENAFLTQSFYMENIRFTVVLVNLYSINFEELPSILNLK